MNNGGHLICAEPLVDSKSLPSVAFTPSGITHEQLNNRCSELRGSLKARRNHSYSHQSQSITVTLLSLVPKRVAAPCSCRATLAILKRREQRQCFYFLYSLESFSATGNDIIYEKKSMYIAIL